MDKDKPFTVEQLRSREYSAAFAAQSSRRHSFKRLTAVIQAQQAALDADGKKSKKSEWIELRQDFEPLFVEKRFDIETCDKAI